MKTEIQLFSNPEFGEVRTSVTESNEPVFCLVDLCEILELNPSKVSQRLNDDVLSKYPILDSIGRQQLANFVNEDGLYDVILDSRKPEARGFRKWVTRDVLPSIRKSGGYITSQEEDTPETIMARALVVAQETLTRHKEKLEAERNHRRAIEMQKNVLEGQKEQLAKENTLLAPKAKYAEEVLQSTSTFTTNQMAQGLGLTAIALNRKLRELGVQYNQSGQWLLTAKYKGNGYATNRVYTYINRKTEQMETSQTMVWTERGREFLHGLRSQGKL